MKLRLHFIAFVTFGILPTIALANGNAPTIKGFNRHKSFDFDYKSHMDWLKKRELTKRERIKIPKYLEPNPAAHVHVLSATTSLSFDFPNQAVDASTIFQIKSQTSSLGEVYIYPKTFLSGDLVVSDEQGPLSVSDYGWGIKKVQLRAPVGLGNILALTVEQVGVPDCSTSYPSIVKCQISPTMTFSEDESWAPFVFDLATNSITFASEANLDVTVPDPMIVASSGAFAGVKTNSDGTKTYSFVNAYQGLNYFAAAPYSVGTLAWGSDKEIKTYVFNNNISYASAWRDKALEIMEFHQDHYGPYELSEINIAEIPDIVGAAFGPVGTVFLYSTLLSDKPQDEDLPGHFTSILAHELAHQWVGGFIIVLDYESNWLSEGFAEMSAMDYTISKLEQSKNNDYGTALRRIYNQIVGYTIPASQDVPLASYDIYEASSEVYLALVYHKGPMIANMLRYLIGGDSVFFPAIRAFREDNKNKKATLNSFEASIKKTTGQDIGDFMDMWLRNTGIPTYSVNVERSNLDGKYGVKATVTTTKDYALPIEIELITADGNNLRQKLPLSEPKTLFNFETETTSEVLQVNVDPDKQILGRVKGALPGDLHFNGEVDGIDLIYVSQALGESFGSYGAWNGEFFDQADLNFDAKINDDDLNIVLASFGTKTGD